MNYYINVKFNQSNKTYYFATDDISLQVGDKIVVETIVGLELAEVVTTPQLLETLNFDREIKPILRKATSEDLKAFAYNLELSEHAAKIFTNHIESLKLDMRLLGTQYTLDRAKVLFTYVADDRVDFRELLKLLASDLHCRIELKQVNTRERAQLVGGLGVCGLPLCCTSFLTQFEGVSLNKAKNQMLSINIPKLSGQCGKLMCCLKYEDDYYTEAKLEYPPLNTKVHYQDAEFKINSFNIFTKIIKLQNATDVAFLSLDEVNALLKNENKSVTHPLDKNPIIKAKPVKDETIKIEKIKESKEVVPQKNKVKEPTPSKSKESNKPQNHQSQKQENKKKEFTEKPQRGSQTPKNKNQNHSQKPLEKEKKFDNNNKKPAKREQNHSEEQRFDTSKFLFAGQANKVKEYQDTYYKNNRDDKQKQNSHRPNNHKTKQNKESKKTEGKK